jgi:ComEC/Rec2-related protein
VAYLARRRPIAFPVAVALAAMTAGFAVATLQALRLGHPILQHPVSSALVAGFVEVREERERSDRIVVGVQRFEAAGIASAPHRARVAVRKGTAPAVGSFVELKAHLTPPLQPLRPGGYEFARDMYFQRIGASGYADRAALTFRTLAVAAIVVLLLAPQAVVHPSFQMSFAATLALIATYQRALPWHPDSDSSLGQRVALWGVREVTALLLASLVAGLATMPYAAYHFHRLAPYGVLANLLAMPVVSALVMPMRAIGVGHSAINDLAAIGTRNWHPTGWRPAS